nr:MAG TPA: hypothetical protein [Caudoviricetes sp.]
MIHLPTVFINHGSVATRQSRINDMEVIYYERTNQRIIPK